MAIQTKYPLKIEIDDKSFSVVLAGVISASLLGDLKEIQEKNSVSLSRRASLTQELDEAEEMYEINKHILAHGKVVEKVGVMFEQKALNKEIKRLKKKMIEVNKELVDFPAQAEALYKKRFETDVSGADKESLRKEIETLKISYQVVFNEFDTQMREAQEKK